MASIATRIPPSIPKPRRKPLQPKNFPANFPVATAVAAASPKKPNITIEEQAGNGKENLKMSCCFEEMTLFSEDVSLAEELEAARRRTERLRVERAREEAKIREMDEAMERWIRVAEKRLNELLVAEMDIRRLLLAKKQRSSCLKSSAFTSLRAREEKKRYQTAQLQEIGNTAGKGQSETLDQRKR